MFSVRQKRETQFRPAVSGAQEWSYADIHNNGAVPEPEINSYNEQMDPRS